MTKTKTKKEPAPPIREHVRALSGAEIERRKAQRVCLFCLAPLSYRFDGDTRTGCLHDFCVSCRVALDRSPVTPRPRFDKKRERRAGLDNLKRLLDEKGTS